MLRRLARRTLQVVRDPRRTRREALVLLDLLRFRARYARVLGGGRPHGAARGTVLVISLTEEPYSLKLEGLLAKALQLAGCRIVVLTWPWQRWAGRYYATFGIDSFTHVEDYVDDEVTQELDDAVAAALAGEIGIQSLRRLTFHGVNVGVQTLTTLSRRFERGRISLDGPGVREALEALLRASMLTVLAGERLFGDVDPDLVLFNEKNYAGYGALYDLALAHGANVVQWVSTGIHARDALVLKRFTEETRRVHPTALAESTWQRVRELPWTDDRERELREEFAFRYGEHALHPDAGLQAGKRIKSVDEVRAQLGLEPGRKTAVIFSHVLWDANMFYGEDLFEDQETWLVETVRAAAANPAVDWIVKLHPANLHKTEAHVLNDEIAIREAIGDLPQHVRILRPETDINTYSLFGLADLGITIRGTIGMELPVFGIPTMTAGTGRYAGLGFTIDSRTPAEYLERLARAHEIEPLDEPTVLLAKRYAYTVFKLRPFPFTSFHARFMSADRLGRHPLAKNLDIALRSPGSVAEAADLRAFADWALGRELDYLVPLDDSSSTRS